MKSAVLLWVLLVGRATFAAEPPQKKWRSCGWLEPPRGLSPVPRRVGPGVRVDSSGSLHCSCSEDPVGSARVELDLADGEGRLVTSLNVRAYPCLAAVCTERVASSANAVDPSNFTSVELLPADCGDHLVLRRTADARVEISARSELQGNQCRGPPSIAVSQTLALNLADSEERLRVSWLAPLDMGSCADSLKQDDSFTQPTSAQVVFYSVTNEEGFPRYSGSNSRHVIARRSNNPPSFVRMYYSEEVAENSPVGTLVATAEASDIDEGVEGEITYSMVPSTHLISAEYFQIHNTSGEITTTGNVDREEMASHSFHVTATDGGGLDTTVFYSISVTDENDNSPLFTVGTSYTVDEDLDLNEAVFIFMVADADEGANSDISFSLLNNTGDIFAVMAPSPSSSGTYTSSLVLIRPLDYETLALYRLTIVARDGGEPSLSSMATVEVTVRDVIDNPPMFTSSEYVFCVPENTSIGTTVFRLNATTLDSPEIATVSYHLQSTSPPDFRFALDISTGAVTVHNELDYEQERLYSLLVRAQTSPDLVTTVTVTINIVNVNDNSPHFIRSVYSGSIMEGLPVGRRVLTVRATDDDGGIFGKICYFIATNDSEILSNFTLNSTTGEISTRAVLDHETQSEYSFEVVARDGGDPPRYDQVAMTIQVENRNDEIPTFLSLAHNTTIPENSGAGVSVAQLEAVDPDGPSLEYYLVNNELRTLFSVDVTSGLVTTEGDLDREEAGSYTLKIEASDGQLTSQQNALVYVTVSDVNDQTPIFPTSGYSVELSEFLLVNCTVVAVEAIDNDEVGPHSDLVYWSPTIPPYFTISPLSGIMTLVQPLDFDNGEHYYNFLVWARDNGSPSLSSSAVVEVTVLDENDNTPQFESGDRSGRVRENEGAFSFVLRLRATDADSGSNAELVYEIVGDDSAREAFLMDGMGVLMTSRSLDREERALYHVVVQARDRGLEPRSSTVEVDVEVTDVIDYPPMFDSIGYETEISVFTPASAPLLTVSATTRDDVSPSSILYSLALGANRTLFRIDRRTGVISAAINIDPVAHQGRYSFHVTAQHQQFSATATVQIEILPDTNTPRLEPLSVYLSVFASLLDSWTTLGAVALERPHDSPLTFSLASSNAAASDRFFSVDPVTGAISVSSAARRGHYTLEVSASSELGVGRGKVDVYLHTVSNSTLESAVVIEFGSGAELHFVSVKLERFAAALTEIVPCSRQQVEFVGVQQGPSNRLSVAIAVREGHLRSYLPREVILDRLLAHRESSRLQEVVGFGSEVCVGEPCPNFQQCSPVLHVHRTSPQRAYKVLQSTEQVYISHSFSPSFTCHCPPGNDLANLCSVETDPCTPSPCHFGAPCRKLHDDYVCDCPPFTGGKNCTLVCPSPSCRPCLPDNCLHGSHCLESPDLTTYSCGSCPWPDEYSGPNCELTSLHISPGGYAVFPSLKSVVKTRISFNFTTVSPDGVLLFAGRVSGSHDLLSVDLVQGQVRVTLSLGDPDEVVTMTTNSRRRLSDGEWHRVRLELEGHRRRVTVTVAGCSEGPTAASDLVRGAGTNSCLLQGRVATRKKSLDVDTMLYIGGVEPHVSLPPFSRPLPHFEGCLSDLVMDDRIVDLASPVRRHGTSEGCPPLEGECPINSCLRGECVSVWNGTICHCEDSPKCGQISAPVSLSGGHMRLELPRGSVFAVETFSLSFRTRQTRATLISFGGTASLQLHDGSVVFSHSSSSSPPHLTTLTIHTTVSDGLWHTVAMTTSTMDGTQLSIDSERAAARSPLHLSFTVTTITLGSAASANHSSNFHGCLADFSINVQRIDLASVTNTSSNSLFSDIESLHVVPGCLARSECTDSSCPAHSTCVSEWWSHSCVCDEGFVPTDKGTCSDPCDPNPCRNEGACAVEGGGWRCECGEGYSGERCEQSEDRDCPTGLFQSPDCKPCYCHLRGVTEDVCESSGRCLCNSSLHVFSPRGDVGCQPCDCHETGSLGPQCLPATGECPCRPGVTGRRCDVCMDGFAGMDSEGCKKAVVVRGLFTLSSVSYDSAFNRPGSPALLHLTSPVTRQLKRKLESFALSGEEEVAITNVKNSSGRVVVNYTVSSYSSHASQPLPTNHAHTLASVLQWVVRSGWVGLYEVDPSSHFLLTDCRSCDPLSRCVLSEASPQLPQPFACDTCPDGHSLDGVVCRRNVNESCVGPDTDQDGVRDSCDSCPYLFNPSQHLDDCATPTGMCPVGHSSGGVLWGRIPQYSTAIAPCDPPHIGYVRRECLAGGVWGEADRRDCLSLRAQQFLFDAESIRQGRVMNIHELLYSVSDVGVYVRGGVAGGVSGGDLGAVGRYVREVAHQLVESAHGTPTDDHILLLEEMATVVSNLLSPEFTTSWTPTSAEFTHFPLSLLPHTLELTSTLFHLYQARGELSRPHLVVQAMINVSSANFSGAVVDLSIENGTKSSVSFPLDLLKAANKSSPQFDVVVGVYPTLASLLPPSDTNMTVASVVATVQLWGKGVAHGNLLTPVIITLAHNRKVHVYRKESAKCVIWQATGPEEGWEERGCELVKGNTTHTTCACSHLSVFAVLLPSSSFLAVEDEDNDGDFRPGVFTYVALSLSTFLLFLTSLALWLIRWSSGNVYTTVYKNLVLSLLLTSLTFLIGIDRTDPPVLCSVFAIVLDFLLISSLFWLLVVGVVTARLLLHPPPKSTSCLASVFLVAGLWTVPALLCVVPVGVVAMASSTFHQDFGYPHYCMVAPQMVLVLLVPIALLLMLVVVAMVVVVVLMQTQRSRKKSENESYTMTPGRIAARQNRSRRHLGIIAVTLTLYLLSWGAGLLAVYGHAFPDPTSSILEIAFAIFFTSLSGFLFTVLSLNKKVRSSVVAKFEPKYQNSSLRAMADSSSLLTRLRVGGGRGRGSGSVARAPPTGRERRQQRLLNETRVEARNRMILEQASGLDLVSMEAHPRTPNTEPLYSQIQPSGSSPDRPRRTRGPAVVLHISHSHSPATGPRQPRPVPRPQRLAPPISSSGADADLDTDDVGSEVARGDGLPWYHVSATEVHQVVQLEQTDVDCLQGTSDNDDSSRVDPSGVSTASVEQRDVEEEQQRGRVSVSCEAREAAGRQRWSRDSVDGSLCVQASETGSRERRLGTGEPEETHRRRSWGDRRTSDPTELVVVGGGGGGEVDELDDLQTRLSSPQPCADPMWYRRGSGCEETGNMPAAMATEQETGQQTGAVSAHQKSVTWADQELGGETNLRHSCESCCSSLSSRSILLEPPSSHEGSPAPTLTPGYPGGLAMPTLSSWRPPPEGVGAMVVFPSHTQPHQRKSSSGSVPPLSPTSLLSSGSSSQHSGQGQPPPPRLSLPLSRGVAAGQSPGKTNRHPTHEDYHSNGPSAQHGNSPATQHSRSRHLIRHNPDGSRTVQSLV